MSRDDKNQVEIGRVDRFPSKIEPSRARTDRDETSGVGRFLSREEVNRVEKSGAEGRRAEAKGDELS